MHVSFEYLLLGEITTTEFAVEYSQDNEYCTVLNDRELWCDFNDYHWGGSLQHTVTITVRAQYVLYPSVYTEETIKYRLKNCSIQII